MFIKINLKMILSAVLMFPLNHDVSGMDYPGILTMKPEPGVIRPAHRAVNPAITLKQMEEVFASKGKKINMHDDRLNCVPCAISCYRWINDQTEYPKRIGKRENTKNIAVDKDFAELIKQQDNQELGSKVVRINLEDGSVTPLNATFSPITMKSEDDFTTLEEHLDKVRFKITLDLSNQFRVGLLYLIYKNQKNKGHMINVYKYIEDSVVKTYIIDPQSGIIKSLSDFTNEYQSEFINYGYIWFDTSENTAGIEFRDNFIKINDGADLPCQGYISNEEGMDVEEDDSFQNEMEQDRAPRKRPREESLGSDKPATKKLRFTKKKSRIQEDLEEYTEEERGALKPSRKQYPDSDESFDEQTQVDDQQKAKQREYDQQYYRSMTKEQKERKNKAKRERYANMTSSEREKKSQTSSKSHLNKTDEQKERKRNYDHDQYAIMSDDQKKKKLEANRKSRAKLTLDQKEERREHVRAYHKSMPDDQKKKCSDSKKNRLKNMTENQKEEHRAKQAEGTRKHREKMTEEEREKIREADRKRIENMSDAKKEKRREADRKYKAKKLATETDAQKEERLAIDRIRRAKKRAENKEEKSQSEKKRKADSSDENPRPTKKQKKK